MAQTLKDIRGWEVITTDENGNIINDNRRRSRKRGGSEKTFLVRLSDGLKFGRGDSVIMDDGGTNTYSVYLIHEIRLNTLNNLVEIWAFSYLRWFELKPQLYYALFNPAFAAENRPIEEYRARFIEEVNKAEIYLTAELSEIWLKDFVDVANIMTESQWKQSGKLEDKDFFVRYICEPTAESYVPIDIVKEKKMLLDAEPKSFEEHLKKMSLPPAVTYNQRPSKAKLNSTRVSGHNKVASLSEIKLETETDDDAEEHEEGRNKAEKEKEKEKRDTNESGEEKGKKTAKSWSQSRIKSRKRKNKSKINTSQTSSPSPPSDAYSDAQETPSTVSKSSPAKGGNKEQPSKVNLFHKLTAEGEDENESGSEQESDSDDAEEDSNFTAKEDDATVDESEDTHEEEDVDSEEEEEIDEEEEEEGEEASNTSPKKVRRKMIPGNHKKSRKLLASSTPATPSRPSTSNSNGSPAIRKFTKRNVARAKKKYTPFSKRFKSVDEIPNLTELAEFNQSTDDLNVAALENKLRTPKKHEIVETIFSKIKKQLYSSHEKEEIVKSTNFQDYLPARENEFASIYLSLYSAIESGSATTVYVAGTPGVGKTLTVREVVKELQRSADQNELPLFQYVEINGLKMVKPTDSYEVLWNKIMGERLTWGAAMESLEFYFNKVPQNKKRPVVVLLDELDALVTKTQDIMYNFFNWTTYENAKLIVIAVANTMDLPERQLGNKVSSRIGFTRIMFTGYTHEELRKIINFRLKGLNNSFFYVDTQNGSARMVTPEEAMQAQLPPHTKRVRLTMSDDAIEIASRKVASVSGDARRALKVCKRAAEIAEQHYMSKHGYAYDGQVSMPEEEDTNDGEELQTVHIAHVTRALNETINSQSTKFIAKMSFTGKLFLYALLNLIKKTELQEQQLGDILDEIHLLIEVNGNNKFILELSRVLFQQDTETSPEQLKIISWDFVINQLVEAGIIFRQSMKNERLTCVKLNISQEDVNKGLEQDENLKNL
ncbi:SIR3 (YLR442C) and ORC1 (YML065W) [Zygosaccharomyces parabailii]|uniref:Origin recognition complex subunit 1 n=1 Tax=Zygosaccharomyces bailii (strain CLIB 213 / ATCC 58445 / CBS 680 / BCRC 21525 / NBRC 1098 / NCYC 1416 / NRRL Y-2227) TaxID=1333698 RepID=A0A8J2TAX0_ZYGB2|nr:SIR3 (YLR442C) and ORC1 (YML065W) [Zygosaccharomyces parabailii]CDF91463.1 ZYBA0S11-03422g1_1 [Zygosaccharomyces bailii CLIB 213]